MRTRLEHILAMVWRTENPKYIIIVKNKADKNMDFTQFKIVEQDTEENKPKEPKKEARYLLTIKPYMLGSVIITVKDTIEGTEPFRLHTSEDKKDYWEKRCKKEYRPLRYQP